MARPGSRPVTEADIIGALKDSIANFKVPKALFVVDELPRNAMGKVRKNILRDRYKDSFARLRTAPQQGIGS